MLGTAAKNTSDLRSRKCHAPENGFFMNTERLTYCHLVLRGVSLSGAFENFFIEVANNLVIVGENKFLMSVIARHVDEQSKRRMAQQISFSEQEAGIGYVRVCQLSGILCGAIPA